MGLTIYSYLSASTGLSLEARHAGYSAKTTLEQTPKAIAPIMTMGVKTGTSWLWVPLKNIAIALAKPHPETIPIGFPIMPISLIRKE